MRGKRENYAWAPPLSLRNRGLTLRGFGPQLSLVHEVRDTNAKFHDDERSSGELRFARVS